MSKYLSLLLMLFIAVCISSCGTKYARPDRCCCDEPDPIVRTITGNEPEPVVESEEVLAESEEEIEEEEPITEAAVEPEKEPEQVQAIKEVIQDAIKEEKKEIKIDFEKLAKQNLFNFDSDKISESSYSGLNFVASFLKENPSVTVKVDGHTDNIGPAEYNKDLSERRAKSVADYIISKGVDANRVSTQGFGFSRPIASNKTAQGRAKNRRTELTFRIQQNMPSDND
jgi:outer membrane protein OmpA-like peptidoglycan-associated protein